MVKTELSFIIPESPFYAAFRFFCFLPFFLPFFHDYYSVFISNDQGRKLIQNSVVPWFSTIIPENQGRKMILNPASPWFSTFIPENQGGEMILNSAILWFSTIIPENQGGEMVLNPAIPWFSTIIPENQGRKMVLNLELPTHYIRWATVCHYIRKSTMPQNFNFRLNSRHICKCESKVKLYILYKNIVI